MEHVDEFTRMVTTKTDYYFIWAFYAKHGNTTLKDGQAILPISNEKHDNKAKNVWFTLANKGDQTFSEFSSNFCHISTNERYKEDHGGVPNSIFR